MLLNTCVYAELNRTITTDGSLFRLVILEFQIDIDMSKQILFKFVSIVFEKIDIPN